jgi:hypothetical protein
MTEGFQTVLAASDEERRDLFLGAANRLRSSGRIRVGNTVLAPIDAGNQNPAEPGRRDRLYDLSNMIN